MRVHIEKKAPFYLHPQVASYPASALSNEGLTKVSVPHGPWSKSGLKTVSANISWRHSHTFSFLHCLFLLSNSKDRAE